MPRKPPRSTEERLVRAQKSMMPGTLGGRVASAAPMSLDVTRLDPRLRTQNRPAPAGGGLTVKAMWQGYTDVVEDIGSGSAHVDVSVDTSGSINAAGNFEWDADTLKLTCVNPGIYAIFSGADIKPGGTAIVYYEVLTNNVLWANLVTTISSPRDDVTYSQSLSQPPVQQDAGAQIWLTLDDVTGTGGAEHHGVVLAVIYYG